MTLAIISLTPKSGGDEVELTVSIESDGNRELRTFELGAKMLFEIGNIGPGVLPYAITTEQFDILEYDSRLWEAVKRGLSLISYADASKRRLAEKLRERGFDRDIASDAADYIASLGFIDESRQLRREVEKLTARGYGRSRIRQELIRKGISREVMDESLSELLDEIDFDSMLLSLLRKKCDFSRLGEVKYRESVCAAMFRYGYAVSDVRRGMRLILSESED